MSGFGTSSQTPFITIAVVTEVKDNENKEGNEIDDKVSVFKVRYLAGALRDLQSGFMRAMTPIAGAQYGMCCWPKVDDEVIVAFLDGDISRPVIIGSLYNNDQLPPYTALPQDKKNYKTMIRTSTGNKIELIDNEGKEEAGYEAGIKIVSCGEKDGKGEKGTHSITLADGDQQKGIYITDQEGKNLISINTKDGECNIKAEKKIVIEAGKGIITIDDNGVSIEGKESSNVTVKGGGKFSVSGNQGEVKASGDLSVSGAMTKIN